MQNTLITGDKGFVGSHLTKAIKGVGFDIKDGFDIRDKYQVETVIQNNNIDTVIHLAALGGVRKGCLFPEDYIDTNIKGTLNLLESARRNGVKHFVNFSSSSVYGNQTPPNTEDSPCNPISIYGVTKVAAEALVRQSGVPYTTIRPFSMYGEGGRKDQVFYKWISQIKDKKPVSFFGDGNALRGYTSVLDLVEAIKLVIERSAENQTYNVGGEDVIATRELLTLFNTVIPNMEVNYLTSSPQDVNENWADISKIKGIGYQPKGSFKKDIISIITKELCR